jgi:hypothetical protein
MAKRKKASAIRIYDDDLNDGSGSDDAETGYTPRAATQQTQRVHHVPEGTISVGTDGRLLSTLTQLAVPASPSKRTRAALNPDTPPSPLEPAPSYESWMEDFSEFDAEYGPGLQSGPRELRGSVSLHLFNASRLRLKNYLNRIIRMSSGRAWIARRFSTSLFGKMVVATMQGRCGALAKDATRLKLHFGVGSAYIRLFTVRAA